MSKFNNKIIAISLACLILGIGLPVSLVFGGDRVISRRGIPVLLNTALPSAQKAPSSSIAPQRIPSAPQRIPSLSQRIPSAPQRIPSAPQPIPRPLSQCGNCQYAVGPTGLAKAPQQSPEVVRSRSPQRMPSSPQRHDPQLNIDPSIHLETVSSPYTNSTELPPVQNAPSSSFSVAQQIPSTPQQTVGQTTVLPSEQNGSSNNASSSSGEAQQNSPEQAQDPAKRSASIPIEGTIIDTPTDNLTPSVNSEVSVVASLGSVSLESGEAATLDFIGDDLINFAITEKITGTATDAAGNIIEQNVSNEGLIRAEGGLVFLSARRSGEIIKNVVNQEGIIEAHSVIERDGRIFLSGGGSQQNIMTTEERPRILALTEVASAPTPD